MVVMEWGLGGALPFCAWNFAGEKPAGRGQDTTRLAGGSHRS